jgi:hypothetical protein
MSLDLPMRDDDASPTYYCIVKVQVRHETYSTPPAPHLARGDERRVIGQELEYGFRKYKSRDAH